MASLLEHFTAWDTQSDFPGVDGLLIPSTMGKGLPNIEEGMAMAGYKPHEIRYIREYANTTARSEQEAVVNLGIGTQDRIAAAIALWKGWAWLPMTAAAILNIKPLRPYAIPPQFGERSPRTVPLAMRGNRLLYLTAHHDDMTLTGIQSRLYTVNAQIARFVDTIAKMHIDQKRFGEILRDAGVLNDADIALCLAEQERLSDLGARHHIGEIIHHQGLIAAPILIAAMKRMGIPLEKLSLTEAEHAHHETQEVTLALSTIGTVEMLYRREMLDTWSVFQKAYQSDNADKYGSMVDAMLTHCAYHGYSDIHFSPIPDAGMIEGRLDGVKGFMVMMQREDYERSVGIILNRMGNVDIRLQAEGRISESILPAELKGRFEFRVQYMHVIQGGETTGSLTLRIMNLMNETADVETLGFTPDDLRYIKRMAQAGKGMILATGPTGSGKTTTMYAIMRLVDAIQTSVQSVENPVEIRVGMWRQHQLLREGSEHEEWAAWNKGLLRNDPDVVLQGEVRNADLMHQVADMSNTGHLVFATYHASDAPLAVGRLREMRTTNGEALDMDMISSLMHCIIAQGLTRRLCRHCCVADDRQDTANLLEMLPEEKRVGMTPMRAGECGCPQCHGTGYRGRFLVYEILKFNRELRQRIVDKQSLAQIGSSIPFTERITGRVLQLIAGGKTSLEEAYRLVEEF